MSTPTSDRVPDIGKDEGTQQMVQDAQRNFPNLETQDAIQQQADMGPGREAKTQEGSTLGRMVEGTKEAAQEAAHTAQQSNPITRDAREKHC